MNVNIAPKLNRNPIEITLSGFAFKSLWRKEVQEEHSGFRPYVWEKLQGSGVTKAESDAIADGLKNRSITLINEEPSLPKGVWRGYLNGKLVEAPTQHVVFVGSCGL